MSIKHMIFEVMYILVMCLCKSKNHNMIEIWKHNLKQQKHLWKGFNEKIVIYNSKTQSVHSQQ